MVNSFLRMSDEFGIRESRGRHIFVAVIIDFDRLYLYHTFDSVFDIAGRPNALLTEILLGWKWYHFLKGVEPGFVEQILVLV